MGNLWTAVLGAVIGVLVVWFVLVVVLLLAGRGHGRTPLVALLRLLPDVLRLLRRLVADRAVPRGVRVRLWLLLGYLLMPIDLVPDFFPVIGHLDDAIVVALALRSVARRAGAQVIAEHWPGSAAGLDAVLRAARVPPRARDES